MIESMRIRNSAEGTHLLLFPVSLPPSGFGTQQGTSSHPLCLPLSWALVDDLLSPLT